MIFHCIRFQQLTLWCSEFNYVRDDAGDCVLLPGLSPRDPDPNAQCRVDEKWYDLTAYRKIPYSTCVDGKRVDHGTEHICPGVSGHSAFFWVMMLFIPISFAGLIGYYYNKKGYGRGYVRVLLCILICPDHLRDSGRSDYQGVATADYDTRATPVSSTRSRACRGSSSASLVSRTSGSWTRRTRSRPDCRGAEGTETCPSTRTHRS